MSKLHLVLVLVLLPISSSLKCFVFEKSLHYAGIVENKDWKVCSYSPSETMDKFTATGLDESNDDVDSYVGQFDRMYVNDMYTQNKHLCFDQKMHIPGTHLPHHEYCVCKTDLCNVYDMMPNFIKSGMPKFPFVINETISYRRLQHLQNNYAIKHN